MWEALPSLDHWEGEGLMRFFGVGRAGRFLGGCSESWNWGICLEHSAGEMVVGFGGGIWTREGEEGVCRARASSSL